MKKSIIAILILSAGYLLPQQAKAQVRVGVNINIGDQPSWRAPGYDYVEYYYLPDIECYYYVPRHQFVYLSGNNWVFSASLPARYRGYDLYKGYKVVINQPRAYKYYSQHRVRYGRGNSYRGNDHHDNGRHRGWKKHHH
jgi:hypothetical protein